MALVQTVHLSMANFKSAPVVPAVQNDSDRQVKMIVDDYTLTSGLTGKIAFERSDGTHYETAAELVLVDNAFVADIDQALTQPGRTMVQLKVTDTLTVSTFNFVIFVEADNSGTVTPQEGIDLVTAVASAEAAADRAESAAETLELDATLTSPTKAAQAKAVGDAVGKIKTAIDFQDNYLLTNNDFESGVWANGSWRTDGNYGKYLSNKTLMPLESFALVVNASDFTNLVVSISCFDENGDYLGNFITNNTTAISDDGKWNATAQNILASHANTTAISFGIAKLSGSTYYDLPSGTTVTVYKSGTLAPNIADRVEALETEIDNKADDSDIATINGTIADIKTAIDYQTAYILTNNDFEPGMWANGSWRSDGNYGKLKSNKIPVELESFTINAVTETLTGLVLTITCFGDDDTQIGTFLLADSVIASTGSYSATASSVLQSFPGAKTLSFSVGKIVSGSYADLPSDISINVQRQQVLTIADRVEALEAEVGSATSTVITVSASGDGNYTTIEDAVTNAIDSVSHPVTILIKPGVYDEHIHVGGNRYLSFVGENRETCIIRSHTGMYTDAPLWIDGNFTIENLTLQMLDDEAPDTWTPGTSQSDPATMLPGYALHIDGGSGTNIDSVYGYKLGVVRNCTLYSVAFPAIGAGLHTNQKLIFDNCDFVRVTSAKYHNDQYQYYTNYAGAMIIHDSTHSGDTNQNLEIKNCRFLCNLGKSATFAFRYGTPANVSYAMIDNTFWCDETASSIVDNQSTDGTLLGYSHGNNNSIFNA